MNAVFPLLQRMLMSVARRNDIIIAVFVLLIVFLMILPVPTFVVDALIALNMAAAAVLIMVGVYLPSPLSFSAFPAVLLLTTLFRLSLSITTTRLILLQADAGSIVESFGNFVVGGNMVVGLVVFLIITIVQFIVITKGSERVAEVSARFSLDAMPGKQMSIDGDMRSGLIDMDTASQRRTELEKESQLYGAMDGAMKFVKGDAIAGIIIIVVNILGGIAVGTMQQGMSTGEAVQLYSILTVGDGLVAQIPALLISITSGIIVTRVTTDVRSDVGNDIATQIMAQPKALLIASALMLGFAMIPGFPTAVFISLALLVGGIGLTLQAANEDDGEEERFGQLSSQTEADGDAKGGGKGGGGKDKGAAKNPEFALSVPLMIEASESFQHSLKPQELNRELSSVRRALYHDLGVPFPGIDLVFRKELGDGGYRILLDEVPVAAGVLVPGKVFVRDSIENIELMGLVAEAGRPFLPNLPTIWADEASVPDLLKADISFMGPAQVLTYHLSFVLRRYSREFIGIQECRFLLEQMEEEFPELVKEVQRLVPIQKLTEIFQRLVSEDISIRNLRLVLQALSEWGQTEKDPILLAEYVRSSLKRHISYKYSSGQNILPAYMLNPDVEEVVRGGIRQTSSGSYLALAPEVSQALVANIRHTVGDLSGHLSRPILLTSMDVRRYVRRLIEAELYELPVLSYQEVTEEITVQPISRISM